MCIGWLVRNVTRNEKNVRMRAYDEVFSVHPSVAFTTFANGWTRFFFFSKNAWLLNAQDCKEIRELRATRATLETIFVRYHFPDARVNLTRMWSLLTISPATFGLAILLVATLATVENFPSVENSTMSSFFCDHDEEEDAVGVEKYVCQFWLSHSKFC